MLRRVLYLVFVAVVAAVTAGTARTPARATGSVVLAVDCDRLVSGIQSACTIYSGGPNPPTAKLAITLTNNTGSPVYPYDYQWYLLNPSKATFLPGNPTEGTSANFHCGPPPSQADTGGAGPNATLTYSGDCNQTVPTIAPGATAVINQMDYTPAPAAPAGSVTLSFQTAQVTGFDGSTFYEVGTCAPVVSVPMTCIGATLTLMPAITVAVDCDAASAGVQSTCTTVWAQTKDVGVVATNNTTDALHITSYQWLLHDPSRANLSPNGAPTDQPSPMSCQSPDPLADTGQDGPNAAVASSGACSDVAGVGVVVPAGGSVTLGKVRYTIPVVPPGGAVTLSLSDVQVTRDGFSDGGSCLPQNGAALNCVNATITLQPFKFFIDCNPAQSGPQADCHVPTGTTSLDVPLLIENTSGASHQLMRVVFAKVRDSDTTRLLPMTINDPAPSLNANPDFSGVTGGWSCNPPGPIADTGEDGPGRAVSSIDCVNSASGQNLPNFTRIELARVHYTIPAGASPGTVSLSAGGVEIHSPSGLISGCNPAAGSYMPCGAATVTLYCQIAQADATHDGSVTAADLGKVASKFGVMPAPTDIDQNFDSLVTAADLGIVATQFGKNISQCP